MAGPTRSRRTLEACFFTCLGLLILGGAPGQGLEQQEWVLIRTADGTVIATNYTWDTGPVTLRADFSKFFDDPYCASAAAIPTLNSWTRGGYAYRPPWNDPCGSAPTNYALRGAPHYGCPEPPRGQRYTCGSHNDFYCKSWGCETLTNGGWTPGGGIDKHILLTRDKSKQPEKGWETDCAADKCNPASITVLNPGDPEWLKGRTWGLRLYISGTDPGTFFTVRRLPAQGRPLLREGAGKLPPRPPKPTTSLRKDEGPSTLETPIKTSGNQSETIKKFTIRGCKQLKASPRRS